MTISKSRKLFYTFLILLIITPVSFAQAPVFDRDLLNLGATEPGYIKAYNQIKLFDAYQYLDSINPSLAPVRIGIIDSGIDAEHPEFQGVDLDDTSAKARIDRVESGHGTQVAGIIGANNISFPNSENYIFPQMNGILSGVKNLDYSLAVDYDGGGSIGEPNVFRVLWDIFDLAVVKGANIINLSSSLDCGPSCSSACILPSQSLFLSVLSSGVYKDTLFVVSAGDTTEGISDVECFIPAGLGDDYRRLITVGGLDSSGEERYGSSPFGNAVNIAAPAEDVYAPRPPFDPANPETYYDSYFGGTSASAPLVAGIAGLLKSIKPELTASEIKDILVQTVDPVATDEPIGGRLNAAKAVAYLFPPTSVYLNSPTDVANNSMILSWTKNEDPDFESYRLYRDTNSDVGLDDILVTTIINRDTLFFIDTSLSPKTTYYYKLFVFDAADLSSGSNEVSATTLPSVPTEWSLPETIYSSPEAIQYRAVTSDNSGNLHMVWIKLVWKNTWYTEAYYLKRDQAGWSEPVVIASLIGSAGAQPDIVVDNFNHIHVVFPGRRGTDTDVFYIMWNGTEWSEPLNISNTPGFVGYTIRMISDNNNNLHVVWGDISASPTVFYVKKTNDTWSEPLAISPPAAADYCGSLMPLIASDSSNNLHVIMHTCLSTPPGRTLYYTKFNGSQWSEPLNLNISSSGNSSGADYDLVVDKFNHPHTIASSRIDGKWGMYHIYWDGSNWTTPVDISGTGNYVESARLTIDDLGIIHGIWREDIEFPEPKAQIVYRNYDGAVWSELEVIPYIPIHCAPMDIIVDTLNRIHVFYVSMEEDGGEIHYISRIWR